MGEDPIGGFRQVNEVLFEDNRRQNLTSQDIIALLVVRSDITLQDRSELDLNTRTGTMKSSL